MLENSGAGGWGKVFEKVEGEMREKSEKELSVKGKCYVKRGLADGGISTSVWGGPFSLRGGASEAECGANYRTHQVLEKIKGSWGVV